MPKNETPDPIQTVRDSIMDQMPVRLPFKVQLAGGTVELMVELTEDGIWKWVGEQ